MMKTSEMNWMQVGAWLAHDGHTVTQTRPLNEQDRD